MNLYLAHGPIHLLEAQPLKRDLLGNVEVQSFVLVDEVDLACVVSKVP